MFQVRRAARPVTLMAVVVAVGVVIPALLALPSASADSLSDVKCDQLPNHPECDVEAGTSEASPDGMVTDGGEVVCRLEGEEVPCVTEDGWLGSDGCRYLRTDADFGPPRGESGPGAWYERTCTFGNGSGPRPLPPPVWLADTEAPGEAALARHALSRLVLPRPEISLSPSVSAPQLVGLPTWLWVEPVWWVSRSATASVPGVSVTATASPVTVRWSTGDGQVVTCEGPGTPYEAGGDPGRSSPDCGYTYVRSSAGQPGGTYELSATVTWEVTWSGNGVSGVLPSLTSTTQLPVAVAEVQAVVVR